MTNIQCIKKIKLQDNVAIVVMLKNHGDKDILHYKMSCLTAVR